MENIWKINNTQAMITKMSFMRLVFACVFGVVVLLFAGCSDSPGDVAKSFYENLEDGDVQDIIEMIHSKNGNEKEVRKAKDKLAMAVPMIQSKIKAKGGIKNIEILEENIEGDKALVRFKVIYKDGSEDTEKLTLIKNGSKWKLPAK